MTLKFAEIWFTGSGQRIFDILLNGQVVQSLFDPYAAAGAQFRAVDRTFSTTSSGTITIALNPIISNPKISAIEIVTATGSAGPVRLNAGGAAWTDGAVSWAADNYYNGGGQYSVPYTIAGTTAQPLYRTERWNLSSLMYSVPVANSNWDVTLRFAEIWFSSAGERVFDIYINGSLVAYHFEIIAAAGGAFRAVDRTFYITSSAGSILVELRPVVSNPKISAIDITPAQNQPATCLLYVDQPSGSPTIIRSGGNAMGGTAALGVATQPAQGNWTLRVCHRR